MWDESKFEPKTLADFVFGNADTQRELEMIVSGELPFPVSTRAGILLYGVHGTGKTALARVLPELIEQGVHGASLNESEEFIDCREGISGAKVLNLIDALGLTNCFNASKNRYVVLDEVDNLDKKSLASLKTAMNKKRIVFILTTNNPSRLDKGVADRCVRLEMNAAADVQMLPLLRRVNSDRGGQLSDEAILDAIAGCNGSFREAIYSTLRAIALKRVMGTV